MEFARRRPIALSQKGVCTPWHIVDLLEQVFPTKFSRWSLPDVRDRTAHPLEHCGIIGAGIPSEVLQPMRSKNAVTRSRRRATLSLHEKFDLIFAFVSYSSGLSDMQCHRSCKDKDSSAQM